MTIRCSPEIIVITASRYADLFPFGYFAMLDVSLGNTSPVVRTPNRGLNVFYAIGCITFNVSVDDGNGIS